MSEPPPPGAAGPDHQDRHGPLTPAAVEAVLADFRAWLTAAPPPEPPPDGPPAFDWHTLAGHFTALRQEVNLQTRAVRAQQEQSAAVLEQLARAVDALSQPRPAPPSANDQLRPVLKGLVDLYDALSLAGREVGRIREAVLPTLDQLANAAAPEPPPLPPEPLPAPPAAAVETATAPAPAWWQRWLSRNPEAAAPTPAPPADAWPRHAAALRELLLAERRMAAERLEPARAAARQARQWLDGVLAGYAMSLQRVERALLQEGLEPIAATGRPFDPEQMEAVEIVTATDRPAGEVLAELRRGYLWKGGVFRYAQVSVAKPVG